MAKLAVSNIRNIALIGHGTCGKTTLVDAMLLAGKKVTRLGSVKDGNSVCDHTEEEISREHSIETGLAYLDWENRRICIMRSPGRHGTTNAARLPAHSSNHCHDRVWWR